MVYSVSFDLGFLSEMLRQVLSQDLVREAKSGVCLWSRAPSRQVFQGTPLGCSIRQVNK